MRSPHHPQLDPSQKPLPNLKTFAIVRRNISPNSWGTVTEAGRLLIAAVRICGEDARAAVELQS